MTKTEKTKLNRILKNNLNIETIIKMKKKRKTFLTLSSNICHVTGIF